MKYIIKFIILFSVFFISANANIVDELTKLNNLLKDYVFYHHRQQSKYGFYYFPSIIFFKTFLNFITESELEFFKALKIRFFCKL